jgi:Abortive infection bacteriophage resistance protein
MKPLKPALTYTQQIKHLREKHGLIIDDEDRAIQILSTVNYYRLSAYGIGLKQKGSELYVNDTSLDTLYSLYRFDAMLRYLLLPVIEEIEINIRTKIAYHFALMYGAEGYTDRSYFNDKTDKQGRSLFDKFSEHIAREKNAQKQVPFVRHHVDEYDGHFPIWVIVEIMSFGALSMMYSIMKRQDQKQIAEEFKVKPDYLESWLISLVEMRNICAHYGRIYHRPLTKSPLLFKEHKKYVSNRLFPLLLAMKKMVCNKTTWRDFTVNLAALIDEFEVVNLELIGFPNEWRELVEQE